MAKKSKKTTAKKTTRKKSVSRKTTKSLRPKPEKTTEVVFSFAEVDFLTKITNKESDVNSTKDRKARLALRDKMFDIDFRRSAGGGSGLLVLKLTHSEIAFLQRITKEVYSFITAEERRARLILREKILIAVEKVTGKRIWSEWPE